MCIRDRDSTAQLHAIPRGPHARARQRRARHRVDDSAGDGGWRRRIRPPQPHHALGSDLA
eukprot:3911715-Rhodomonas_salina.2